MLHTSHDKLPTFNSPVHQNRTRLMIERMSRSRNDAKFSLDIHIIWSTNFASPTPATQNFYGWRIWMFSPRFWTSFTFFEGDIKCLLMVVIKIRLLVSQHSKEKDENFTYNSSKRKVEVFRCCKKETRKFHISNDMKLKVLIARTFWFAYLHDLIFN